MSIFSKKQTGFTIVELSIVIVVIGILAAISIIGYGSYRNRVATVEVTSDINNALAAMESSRYASGSYPLSMPASFTASPGVTFTYVSGDASNFCIQATSKAVPAITYYVKTSDNIDVPRLGTCAGGPGGTSGSSLALTDNFDVPGQYGSTSVVRMAIRGDGTIRMWGNGQTTPTAVQAGSDWASGSTGPTDRCAIKTTGTLWCWTGVAAATQVGSATDWLKVSIGYQHICGVKTTGILWCWKGNQYSEIGDGTTTASAAPKQVGSDTDWKDVKAGYFGTCAVKTTGTRWCWGYNGYASPGYSAFGNSSIATVTTPAQMSSGLTWSNLTYAAISGCGVTSTGALYCWGQAINTNDSVQDGRLGLGAVSGVQVPTRIGTASDWRDVNMGSQIFGQSGHTCATKTDNTLWCWGAAGRVGNGANAISLTPVQIAGAWKQVEATGQSTCGVKTDDTVWCWGSNSGGQLGDGTTTDRLSPVQITVN